MKSVMTRLPPAQGKKPGLHNIRIGFLPRDIFGCRKISAARSSGMEMADLSLSLAGLLLDNNNLKDQILCNRSRR